MKKTKLKLNKVFIILILVMVAVIIINVTSDKSRLVQYQEEVSLNDYVNAYMLLNNEQNISYQRFLNENDITYGLSDLDATLQTTPHSEFFGYEGVVALLNKESSVSYAVDVNMEGLYYFNIDYFVDEEVLTDVIVSIAVNGETQYNESDLVILPLQWRDVSKIYETDRYNDQLPPSHERIVDWMNTDFYDNRYTSIEPLLFNLETGINNIEITTKSLNDIYAGQLKVVAPKNLVSYEGYLDAHPDNYPVDTLVVNSIEYVSKNSPFVRPDNETTPNAFPSNNKNKMINILSGWDKAGQEIVFNVDVEQAGFYSIYTHGMVFEYDFSVFRTIKINGEVPFEEARALEIKETNEKYEINDFGFKFYLNEGENTISFKNEVGMFSQSIDDLQYLINHINEFSLDVKKASGSNIDEDRTWDFTNVIPETESYLTAYRDMIIYNIVRLSEYGKKQDLSIKLSYLNRALRVIDKILEEPDDLPLYVDDLYMGSGSVNQLLGDTIQFINSSNYEFDLFIISNEDQRNYNATFIQNVGYFLSTFINSFSNEKYTLKEDSESIQIWVSRQTTYVDLMQKMIDKDFTIKTGIRVDLSVMPNVDKLVLSSAAGNTPDGALGLPSYVPYKLALRGTLYDLTEYDDFWTYSADKFVPGSYIPYAINDGVYAMPETLTFNSLVYREDIFTKLDLEVPDTWDDVIGLLPKLQRYDMNFYYPTAGGGSIKWFYQTTPFLYQNNGQIYNENGYEVDLTSPESIKGIEFLGNLYTTYSLPEQVPSFYNDFRYSKLPVGIIDFNTYVTLKNAAPEIEGKWKLANYPGTLNQETNVVNRSYVGNGTSGIVFKNSDKKDQVWEFMKWWQSEETQTTFAYDLYTTYGPLYLWLPANKNAIANLPIDDDDKLIILEQIKWLRDVPRTPGQYMVERGLSDIWNEMVFSGYSARYAIDRQVLIMNREIRLKMTEFGYFDDEGNMIKDYSIRDYDYFYNKFLENGLEE
ncbi:MAG: extracellular solute-binding protein [Acholeplasmataceae bacterium]|nr:extracellular solute-binding protein [Acholeplasmataceae bacterium]